jgi:putative ATP-dependent endonuclease of OLD family
MYLSELRLWNFRKYGVDTDDLDGINPGVIVLLNPGLNVLIGENDSGKTAIVDAIRHLLGAQSREWYRLDSSDFHGTGETRAKRLKIEAIFRGFNTQEAAPFLEWMGFEEREGLQEYILVVRLTAERKSGRIVMDLRAGPDAIGAQIDGDARELLRVTYLKPLRDAEGELTPGRRSRLAQILAAHKLFQDDASGTSEQKHKLEEIVGEANNAIKQYFCPTDGEAQGSEVMQRINGFLTEFFPDGDAPDAEINISGGGLSEILRRLALVLEENSAGLGSLNLLYIAAELLLLQSSECQGLRLGIVEELEAHLHPQAQLRLIGFLDKHTGGGGKGQFILTTHSTTLGASIDMKNLLICRGDHVFPMAPKFTKLEPKNYSFLRRFLDATKANLFFARGIILVEGDAENLLLPTIAEIINRPLHRYGVSIVNVGSIAFIHYAKIFARNDGQTMAFPVAVVTDMDVKPLEWQDKDGNASGQTEISEAKAKKREMEHEDFEHEDIRVFISPNWTLEYEIALDPVFRKRFYRSVLWAEKLSNAKTGEPQFGKDREVMMRVAQDLKTWSTEWETDTRNCEKIAFEIYKTTMLDKNISKAITAQVFAQVLTEFANNNKVKLANYILKSEHLSYLVDAICHVTVPRDLERNDASNH